MIVISSSSNGFLIISLLITFGVLIFAKDANQLSAQENEVPLRFRSEGQIIIEIKNDTSHNLYHLPFIEFVDSVKFQAAVSIGYVSHAMDDYYKKLDSPLIGVSEGKFCKVIENSTTFVPEISWLADILLPASKVEQGSEHHLSTIAHNIGPTGLFQSLLNLQKNIDPSKVTIEEYVAEHRYIGCQVDSRKFRLESKKIHLHLEIYHPNSDIELGSSGKRFFSIKATASLDKEHPSNGNKLDTATLAIDYLYFHPIDLSLDGSADGILQLPLGRGCSQFLKQIKPNFAGRSSFSFDYKQLSARKSIKLSYDHSSALLQREALAAEISIWDLNKNLLINLGNNLEALYSSNSQTDHDNPKWDPCAILIIEDKRLSPALRPNQDGGPMLDLLSFIGASSVAYMGHGSVRNLPCFIFESIVPKAPAIFGLTESRSNEVRDYIVQFYLLRGRNHETVLESNLSAVDFKPLRLVLLSRSSKGMKDIEKVEELEVYDFSWFLDTTTDRKLFKALECFGGHASATEQVKLEGALTFERVEAGHSDISASKYWFEHLWPLNKLKLELEVLNDLLKLLETSRLHMIDYELEPRARHLDVSLDLADWAYQPRRVSLIAEGRLSSELIASINQKDTIRYRQLSEYVCVWRGSVIKFTSLVVYCGENIIDESTTEISACITAQGREQEINLMNGFQHEGTNTNSRHCRAYRFEKLEVGGKNSHPLGSVGRAIDSKNLLDDHWFEFDARTPAAEGREKWRSKVKNFDLKHNIKLEEIENYAFSMDDSLDLGDDKIYTYNSTRHKNLEDCRRMCDMAVSCRSYSFCLADEPTNNSCAISALDLRASKIREQVDRKQQSNAENVTVNGHGQGIKYNLINSKKCKIHERNYLDMFRETEQVIRLKGSHANQFPKTDTTFGCAELSSKASKQVAIFAYCATSKLCIMDENLFPTDSKPTRIINFNFDPDDESACRVYRKKYQSFYRVSNHIVKQSSLDKGQQLRLNSVDSVEGCASFCWDRSDGQCRSFDYCELGICLINQIESHPGDMELKAGCLHYEPDFGSQLTNGEHETGRQQLKDSMDGKPSESLVFNLLSCSVALASIILGMRLGNRFRCEPKPRRVSIHHLFDLQSGPAISNNEADLKDQDYIAMRLV